MNTNKFFTHLSDALHWVNTNSSQSTFRLKKKEKLHRITKALELFNNPHHNFKSIHITGSKGKTSTAYACSYILKTLHYKTGLFTSPHIHSYNERIRINHTTIDDEILLHTLNEIYTMCNMQTISLTMFEIFTLSACILFSKMRIEYAIFEVGIGGMFDTTNFLSPILCIITTIEQEHSKILGTTIEEITKDKSGIIKNNTPVWIGTQTNVEALHIIQKEAAHKNAPCYYFSDYITLQHTKNTSNKKLSVKLNVIKKNNTIKHFQKWNKIEIQTPSISSVLLENQVLADVALHSILHKNPQTSTHIYTNNIQLFCRSELIETTPYPKLYLDGAHTENSIRSSMECIQTLSDSITVLVGLSPGKNYIAIAKVLSEYKSIINNIIVTRAGTFKRDDSQLLFHSLKKYFKNTIHITNEIEAMKKAIYKTNHNSLNTNNNSNTLICVLGSFYLCADCRLWWLTNRATHSK